MRKKGETGERDRTKPPPRKKKKEKRAQEEKTRKIRKTKIQRGLNTYIFKHISKNLG